MQVVVSHGPAAPFLAFMKKASFGVAEIGGKPGASVVSLGEPEIKFAVMEGGKERGNILYVPVAKSSENATCLAAMDTLESKVVAKGEREEGSYVALRAPAGITVVFMFMERVGRDALNFDVAHAKLLLHCKSLFEAEAGSRLGAKDESIGVLDAVVADIRESQASPSPTRKVSSAREEEPLITPRRSKSDSPKKKKTPSQGAPHRETPEEKKTQVNEAEKQKEAEEKQKEEEDDDDDDIPQGTPIPNMIVKMHMGEEKGYRYVDPNTRSPIHYESEYFKGAVLFMQRMDDRPIEEHPYRWRFDKQKYQFEIQVQGSFRKIPSKEDFLFIGAEISRKMTLGLITKSMCATILNVGRSINRWLHHSFGDDKNMELPHIAGPMWSALDHLVITREGDTPPTLGTSLKEIEDPVQKKARKSDPEYDVGIDVGKSVFTMSFKSSNLNLNQWTVENIPLLTGTDLHTFWNNASLRIGTWLVPRSPDLEMVGSGVEAMPKYHKQATNRYLFSVEVQHISNLTEEELAEVESHMLAREARSERKRNKMLSNPALGPSEGSGQGLEDDRSPSTVREEGDDFSSSPMLNLSSAVSPTGLGLSPPIAAVMERRRRLSTTARMRRSSFTALQGRDDAEEDAVGSDSDSGEEEGSENESEEAFFEAYSSLEELTAGASAQKGRAPGVAAHSPLPEGTPLRPHANPALLAAAQARFQTPSNPASSSSSSSSPSAEASRMFPDSSGGVSTPEREGDQGEKAREGTAPVSAPAPSTDTVCVRPQSALTSMEGTARYVLAVVEVDENRFLKTRTASGGTGRRTLYVFFKPQALIVGSDCPFVLRTYREFCEAFPLYKVQREKVSKRQKLSAGLNNIGSAIAGKKQEGSTTLSFRRLAESEQRRQNLDLSYRTLLNSQVYGGLGSCCDQPEDRPERRKLSKFLNDEQHIDTFLERKDSGGGVSSKRLRQGLGAFAMEGYVCVELGNFHFSEEYLGLSQDSLVFIKPSTSLGQPRTLSIPLLSVMSVQTVPNRDLPFYLPSMYAFSVTTFSRHFVILIKGEKLLDQWLSLIAAEVVRCKQLAKVGTAGTGNGLTVRSNSSSSGDSAGSHSSDVAYFHRHLDLTVKPRGFNLAGRLILNARAFVRDCPSLFFPLRLDADADADAGADAETGAEAGVAGGKGATRGWAGRSVDSWLAQPHMLVEELLRRVVHLAALEEGHVQQSATTGTGTGAGSRHGSGQEEGDNEEHMQVLSSVDSADPSVDSGGRFATTSRATGDSGPTWFYSSGAGDTAAAGGGEEELQLKASESSWVDFMNGLTLLQAVDLRAVDPTVSSDHTLCLLLNLYHTMLVHAFLVFGRPDSPSAWDDLVRTASYEAFGDVFSISELEYTVIKRDFGNSKKSFLSIPLPGQGTTPGPAPASAVTEKYSFEVKRGSDARILTALRHGDGEGGQGVIPIYTADQLQAQLDSMAKDALDGVDYSSSSSSSSKDSTLTLPAYLDGYAPLSLSSDRTVTDTSGGITESALISFLLKHLEPSNEISSQLQAWHQELKVKDGASRGGSKNIMKHASFTGSEMTGAYSASKKKGKVIKLKFSSPTAASYAYLTTSNAL